MVAAHQQEGGLPGQPVFPGRQRGPVAGLPVGRVDDLDVAARQAGGVPDLFALIAHHDQHAVDTGVAERPDGPFDQGDAAQRQQGFRAALGDPGEALGTPRGQHDTDAGGRTAVGDRSRGSGVGR